jgi:hypothetical protein
LMPRIRITTAVSNIHYNLTSGRCTPGALCTFRCNLHGDRESELEFDDTGRVTFSKTWKGPRPRADQRVVFESWDLVFDSMSSGQVPVGFDLNALALDLNPISL